MTSPIRGWDNGDLPVLFNISYTPATRVATRYIPPTETHTNTPAHEHTGAITGGTVGGCIALIAGVLFSCFCLCRQHKRRQVRVQHITTETLQTHVNSIPLSELPSPSPTNIKSWVDSQKGESPKATSGADRRPLFQSVMPQAFPELDNESVGNDTCAHYALQQHLQHYPLTGALPNAQTFPSPSLHNPGTSQQYPAPPPHPQPFFPRPPFPGGLAIQVTNIGLPVVRSPLNAFGQDRSEPYASSAGSK